MDISTPKMGATFSPHARWRALPLESVLLNEGFWAKWQDNNRQISLQHGYRMLEKAGNLDNLRIAAGRITGKFRGMVFQDSDIYKWLEAVGYNLHIKPDPELRKLAD